MRGSKRRPGAHPRAVAAVTPGGHRATRNSQGAETAQCPTTDKWTNKTGRTQTTERYSAVTGSIDARYDRTNPENPVLGGSRQTRKASRRGIPRMRKVQTRKSHRQRKQTGSCWGPGRGMGTAHQGGVSFWGKENILELMATVTLKTSDSYTLSRCGVWCVDRTSVKLLIIQLTLDHGKRRASGWPPALPGQGGPPAPRLPGCVTWAGPRASLSPGSLCVHRLCRPAGWTGCAAPGTEGPCRR